MIDVQEVTLHHLDMKLVTPFQSSIETVSKRESILIEVRNRSGQIGWGEVVAFSSPWYTEETIETCHHMLKAFLIPELLAKPFQDPEAFIDSFSYIRRNQMAKAAIEGAVWDLHAKLEEKPLAAILGGTAKQIDSGVVVGLASMEHMLETIGKHVSDGYKRIKIKIKPGSDAVLLGEIRRHFPNIPLMADANSAYTLDDISLLKQLDEYNLLMIEQPLAHDDIIDHAVLQSQLKTPICLDESIISLNDAKKAIQLGSCGVINIKPGRVGGLLESIKIHDYCMEHNVPVWVGGMLETGVSRAHNIALASLPNFTIPGDISASARYWEEDIISPPVTVNNGKIDVPAGPGLGFEVDLSKIAKYSTYTERFTK
ncbi:o-succinylbenzoate synthase [Metabacillus idriensis]|uniref:o-succinylbenzoate synthase n=1 Tax=Metabacillus idriensis TaxID=324768 RepID=UPI00281441E1|nr:o-succinylbenzoate synthase [Metabacillus idriensis]MDR0137901.1 o-succinylbenzoate synthase [Metabacillus idriensis]